MIICGYPCIGKSCVARMCPGVIDLESSHFKVFERDNSDWEVGYCKMAKELSDQGYIVFTSTHIAVRNMFKKLRIKYSLAFPKLGLKDQWIRRAKDRAQKSGLYKDVMAAQRICDYYEADITELMNEETEGSIIIDIVPFDLRHVLQQYIGGELDVKIPE